MELVEGRPLTRYATANRLGVRERLKLLAKVCDAVQHAHQKGVIHRDLKPGNILVDESGQPRSSTSEWPA
jgi:non-specific serine/threonine protein kinase/serine/threonine-protein kinase